VLQNSEESVNGRLNQAMQLHQAGQLARAQGMYEEILAIRPENADALHLLGIIAYQAQNHHRAVELIDRAIELFPKNATYYSNRGLAQHGLNNYSAAVTSYDQAISLSPEFAEAWYNRGLAFQELKQLDSALESYGKAIQFRADYAEAWSSRGLVLKNLEKYEAALTSYDRALELNPAFAEAWSGRGNVLVELKRYDEALISFEKAIQLKPDFAIAWSNRGNVLLELKQYDAAISSYDKTIELNPAYAEAWSNRGLMLLERKQYDAALSSFERAVELNPAYAEAWSNRGLALQELKQYDAALQSYEKAIALKTDYFMAYFNRGNLFLNTKQFHDAVASYDKAIELKPDFAVTWSNRGVALSELKQFTAALASYDQAITLKSDYAEVWSNRGAVLGDLRQLDAAVESFAKALSLTPYVDYLQGGYLFSKMAMCDWRSFDEGFSRLIEKIENNERASTPFLVLSIVSSLSMQQQVASIFVADKHPSRSKPGEITKRNRRDKIRIGYYSADYHNHATMLLMAEMFEKHDRSKFEIIGFSFDPDKADDEMRKRVISAFDQFIDVRSKTDREVAVMSRELEIDIAVDLKGFTKDARTDIFTYRAAPIQVNYLGYPGTMGAEYMDYLVADPVLIPEQSQQFYTEKIAYLPNSYQVNDARREIADKVFLREELGLPGTGFVFCCFNNNYKITPDTFDCWMRILKSVEGSILWLLEDNPHASMNLRKEAVQRGVDADRLVFARRVSVPEHLARHRLADLFLDTLPYNAHTTASDALWAGVPVLTCPGESFAGRVAASLLNAIHLPELITSTQAEYEAMAVELATGPEKLIEIRRKLEKNRLSAPLFDCDLFTRHIEAAYEQMYERYHLDLPPDHIYVKPADPVARMQTSETVRRQSGEGIKA